MNIRLLKRWQILLAAASCVLATNAAASIAYKDYHHKVTQPDGSTLELVINGSTYYADQRTTDGYPVIYDSKLKGYAYAKLDRLGLRFVSTGILAGAGQHKKTVGLNKSVDIPSQAKRALAMENVKRLEGSITKIKAAFSKNKAKSRALNGSVRGLTLLIQFPDEAGDIPKSAVENFTNALQYTEYGNAQSIRGYYRAVSNNELDYTNTVTAYYTARNNKAYYTNPDISYGIRAQELIREALVWANDTQGFDFSTLTTDNFGKVMGLNIFYAGDVDGGWGQGLWPHKANLQVSYCADGVCASGYQISNMGSELSIGTFVHETGHLIANWPDLYDYDGSSWGSAASHCSMGFGILGDNFSKRPLPPNGYFRHMVGWETVKELNPLVDAQAPAGELSLQANSNNLYRWSNPDKDGEAFYLEARNKSGQSTHMLDEGLIIWHVDKQGNNNKEWHPLVQMEHADGTRDPENKVNRGDQDDMYDASFQDEFGYDLPNALAIRGTNSRWWNGGDSGLEITDISAVAPTMSFTVNAAEPNDPVATDLYHETLALVPNSNSGQTRYFTFTAPPGVEGLRIELTGNNGDADLYVKQGGQASTSDYDCHSQTLNSSNEVCTVEAGDGQYSVAVVARTGINNLTIKGSLLFSDSQNGERYVGALTEAQEVDIHPDGRWFRHNGGNVQARLSSSANTRFRMRMEQWRNMSWVTVAFSSGSDTDQQINYNAGSGYYRIKIYSSQGTGNYVFDLDK